MMTGCGGARPGWAMPGVARFGRLTRRGEAGWGLAWHVEARQVDKVWLGVAGIGRARQGRHNPAGSGWLWLGVAG